MITQIILTAFACFAFVGVVQQYKFLLPASMWYAKFKPLDCAFCLAFWVGIISFDLPIFERIIAALASAGMAKLIDKI